MSIEPDVEEMLSRPKTFWTSIKQICPIEPYSSKSENKRSFRWFIKDLIDCLKACGKLLLVAVGCTVSSNKHNRYRCDLAVDER